MANSKSIKTPRPAFLTHMRGLGGGETSLLNLLEELSRNGIRPLFLVPMGDLFREASNLNIDIYHIEYPDVHLKFGFIPTFSIRTIIRIAQIFLKERVNIVQAESLMGLYYGGLAAFLTGIPFVASYFGFWRLDSRVNQILLNLFCRRIYPISNVTESELRQFLGSTNKRIFNISLGVNADYLKPLPTREEARIRLDLPQNRSIVLHVARFQEIKGHHHLLDALSILLNEMGCNAPIVLFVGNVIDPPSQDVLDYKNRIERKADNPELKPYVRFFGHRMDVPLLMRAADVVVSPSEYETFGMTIIEAMSVGTPVVSTNAGGPSEILEHRLTGLLVPPKDPISLAGAIREVLENQGCNNRMVKNAREVAMFRYGPSNRCKALLGEYEHILRCRIETKDLKLL